MSAVQGRRLKACPHCRRPFPPALPVHGPVRQRIVDLIANRPDGITRHEIIAAVYATDPNGGPKTENVISVLVKKATSDLAPLGYRIITSGGPGARYRLERRQP
jgi:hypothetical protein